jgi:FlaG/FlaF family flagellin (archaellin)
MISLSKMTVSATAAANTAIGTLALLDDNGVNQIANWSQTPSSAGYFATLGASIITVRASIPAGFYAVTVRANAQHVSLREKVRFVIQVM